jgi:NADH-quinone oxidoreductase subunit A
MVLAAASFQSPDAASLVLVLLFFGLGLGFVTLVLFLASQLRPNRPNAEKNSPYECGELVQGDANAGINARFYQIAILFVLFEAEILLLFPWALVFRDPAIEAWSGGLWQKMLWVEMVIFVGLLILALVYAWRQGYLDWNQYSENEVNELNTKVPDSLYQAVNQKFGKPFKQDELPRS